MSGSNVPTFSTESSEVYGIEQVDTGEFHEIVEISDETQKGAYEAMLELPLGEHPADVSSEFRPSFVQGNASVPTTTKVYHPDSYAD